MLEVRDLKKVYHDDSGDCLALDGVSFKLPSKGMVFVVGKSGCGKTTLLNTIGGLDQFTSGDILVNNKGLSKFSVVELDNYRNSTVGFVFQDFCLIERLSVIDNIKLSLEFQNSDKQVDFEQLLKNIGLEGLGHRYPKQLSAGQKQRVAIARAIVKDPEVILADEPTGNLDENTSNQIMDLLKEISKERLVMVISHNPEEANQYADRILEMADGKIISDKAINEEYLDKALIEDDKTILPGNGIISFEELDLINDKIEKSNGDYKITQSDEKFIKKEPNVIEEYTELKKVKMSSKTKLKYAGFFFKKKLFFNLFMIILLTVVTSFLAIIEVLGFLNLNEEIIRINEEEQYDQSYFYYNTHNTNQFEKVNTELIEGIVDKYNSKVNYIYPITLSFTSIYESFVLTGNPIRSNRINNGRITESNGVYITDYKTMIDKVNDGKEVEILAGEIKEDSTGVIITDYLADCILFYDDQLEEYDDIINAGFLYHRLQVDAIISSDIYTKYEEELKLTKLEDGCATEVSIVYDYSLCYTFNKNFIEEYKTYICENGYEYAYANNVTLTSGRNIYSQKRSTGYFVDELADDEILISYPFYNDIFDANLNKYNDSSFTPVKLRLQLFDLNNECFFNKEFTIVGLYEQYHHSDTYRLSKTYYNELADVNLVPWIIEIDNQGEFYDLVQELLDNNCTSLHTSTRYVVRTIELLSVFYEVFMYISFVVIIAIFLIIILNASTIIRQNVYEIGVMNALGAKTNELVTIFTLQMLITCLCVCLLLYSCSNIFMVFANKLLCSGISAYIGQEKFYNVIVFSPKFFIINIVSITVFTVASIMVPILAIRKIKPLKIIKTRN